MLYIWNFFLLDVYIDLILQSVFCQFFHFLNEVFPKLFKLNEILEKLDNIYLLSKFDEASQIKLFLFLRL